MIVNWQPEQIHWPTNNLLRCCWSPLLVAEQKWETPICSAINFEKLTLFYIVLRNGHPWLATSHYNKAVIYARFCHQNKRVFRELIGLSCCVLTLFAVLPSIATSESPQDLEQDGLHYLSTDQPAKAVERFSKLISAVNYNKQLKDFASVDPPTHMEAMDLLFKLTLAYNCRGIAYGEMGKKVEAMHNFNQALTMNPNYAHALTNRGILFSQNGKLQLALRDLSRAITLNPRLSDAYEARAKVYTKLGEAINADRDQRAALDRKNQNERNVYTYGHLESEACHLHLFQINNLIAAHPHVGAYYAYRADAKLGLRMAESALHDANKSLQLKRTADALSARSIAYEQLGDLKRAIVDMKAAVALGPVTAQMYDVLARLDWNSGNHKKAIEDRTVQIKLDPKESHFYAGRAHFYYLLKDYSSAIRDYNQAVKLENPDPSPILISRRGMSYLKDGKVGLALADANMAIKIDPYCATAYLVRGMYYRKIGSIAKASADIERAVKLEPDAEIFKERAELAAGAGNFEQSFEDMKNAQEMDLQLKMSPYSGLKSAINRSDFEKAIAGYTKLIKIDPLNKDALFNRGVLFLCINEPSRALPDFNQFIKLDNWSGISCIHAALLSNIALRKLNRGPEAILILQQCKNKVKINSPAELQFYLGQITAAQAIKNAVDQSSATVVRSFIGLYLECNGDRKAASQQFKWVVDNGDKTMDGYSLSVASLQLLKTPQ